MLDIKFIRDNKDLVKAGAKKKGSKIDIDRLLTIDDRRRQLLAVVEEKRRQQNESAQMISTATSDAERQKMIDASKAVKRSLHEDEEKLKETMMEWQKLMLQVPNVPDMSVPEGEGDADNQELRIWGEKPEFSFEPKSHIDLMKAHDMVDFERGTKVAGFRGYFLKNDGVRLKHALFNFVIDSLLKHEGNQLITVPSLVRKEPFLGTGYLPEGEEDLYKTQDGDYLAGTSEVATMAYYMDEMLKKEQFPIQFLAQSPCFRREAGSHGKDTKGLMRVHEFDKLEQVILCEASHQESVNWHEELLKRSENILQALELPYHVVVNCGGDLGLGQVKKYDIEAWVPSEGKYRETHSCSYFHDFQTRRLNIRYKDTDGKMRYAHSLNNTAIAAPRILIPLVENNQQKDGSIKIPEVLVPYMGKEVIKKS